MEFNSGLAMVISCPACSRQFQVSEIIESGRVLRCLGCHHVWPYMDTVSVVDTMSEPVVAVKERSHFLGGFLFTVVLFLAIPALLILLRHHVVQIFPKTAAVYLSLNLPVPQPYFEFQKTFWTETTIDNKPALKISGEIVHSSNAQNAANVPTIQVSIYGKGQCGQKKWYNKALYGVTPQEVRGFCLLDRWIFKPQDTLAMPGEIMPFETSQFYQPEVLQPQSIVLEFI